MNLAICVLGLVRIQAEVLAIIVTVPAIQRLTTATLVPPPEPTSPFVQLVTEVAQSGGRKYSSSSHIKSIVYEWLKQLDKNRQETRNSKKNALFLPKILRLSRLTQKQNLKVLLKEHPSSRC